MVFTLLIVGNNAVMYQNETFGNPDMRQLKNRAQKSNQVDRNSGSSDGLGIQKRY